MFLKKYAKYIIPVCISLLLYACGSGDGGGVTGIAVSSSPTTTSSTSATGTTNYPAPSGGCGTSCSAGAPIHESSGVWRAQNPSCECINAAIASASSGDTVKVPSGSYNWGNNYLSVSIAIKLIGAGSGSTIINSSAANTLAVYTGNMGNFPLRISGFKFLKDSGNACIRLNGAGSGWRIDNNIFEKSSPVSYGVYLYANESMSTLNGLIDNNTFNHTTLAMSGGTTSANESWTRISQLDSSQRANAVFIENNTFKMGDVCGSMLHNSVDSNNGWRVVIRYNSFNDAYIMAHSACEKSVRGTKSYEIYNNVFRRTCSDFGAFAFLRAGSHIITNNLVTGTWYADGAMGMVVLDNRRSWFDSYCTSGFGNCDGSSTYDTNISNSVRGGSIDGYRCLDQPGAGTGAIGHQTLDPIYVWNNTAGNNCLGGTNKYSTCTSNSDCPGSTCSTYDLSPNEVYLHNNTNYQPYHIAASRDYHENTARPGWSAYTCPHPLSDLNGGCTSTPGPNGYNK